MTSDIKAAIRWFFRRLAIRRADRIIKRLKSS
jgi:glutathione peroxidase-family protein